MSVRLPRSRWSARGLAVVLVGLMLVGTSGLVHLAVADDLACQRTEAAHDASAHRVEAAGGNPRVPEHCFTCHWLRDFRPLVAPGERLGPETGRRGALDAVAPALVGRLLVPGLPARAPPA